MKIEFDNSTKLYWYDGREFEANELLKEVQKKLKMKNSDLSEYLLVSRATVDKWRSGVNAVPHSVFLSLRLYALEN
ncbi:hypothetical protein RRL34_004257 [Vibrio parahaemolyticus]|nr:hypothetical protein [Vibrio parahaemolyticus]